jgi:hypothetical protein
VCDAVDPCDGAELCDGALLAGALLAGALGFDSFLCCPNIKLGTAIISRRIPLLRRVFPFFRIRFIAASWPFNFSLEFHKLVLIAPSSVYGRKPTRRWVKPKEWKKVLQTPKFILRPNASHDPQSEAQKRYQKL